MPGPRGLRHEGPRAQDLVPTLRVGTHAAPLRGASQTLRPSHNLRPRMLRSESSQASGGHRGAVGEPFPRGAWERGCRECRECFHTSHVRIPMKINVQSAIQETPRVLQVRGMFDLPPAKTSSLTLGCRLAAERTAAGISAWWSARPGAASRPSPGISGPMPSSANTTGPAMPPSSTAFRNHCRPRTWSRFCPRSASPVRRPGCGLITCCRRGSNFESRWPGPSPRPGRAAVRIKARTRSRGKRTVPCCCGLVRDHRL